jgi:hypothetical protein
MTMMEDSVSWNGIEGILRTFLIFLITSDLSRGSLHHGPINPTGVMVLPVLQIQ